MTQTTMKTKIEELVKGIDAKNAPYIMEYYFIKNDIDMILSYEEEGNVEMMTFVFENLGEKIAEFDGANLTPANVEVGQGVSQCFYSDRHACTIIKKTAQSITIQRDKATIVTKPEFVPGGFAGHCTNNNSIEYTYEADPNGEVITYRWSKKRNRYQNNYSTLIKGRHEKYDYNF